MTPAYQLAPNSALHAHRSDEALLLIQLLLTVEDVRHLHAANALWLCQQHYLLVAYTNHAALSYMSVLAVRKKPGPFMSGRAGLMTGRGTIVSGRLVA